MDGALLGVNVLVLRTDQRELDAGLASARANAERTGVAMQKSVDQRMVSMGSSMRKTGASLSRYLTVPLVGVGLASADLAQKFEQAMEMIHTQAGASQKEVANLRGEVLALAKTLPQSPQQLAEGLFHLESIGLRGAKALNALKIAAQGAAVGNASLEDTATALGSAWLVHIKGATDLRGIMATLNATVGAGNMRMGDLVSALGTGILPAAKLAGLSLQDVSGAIAVLSDEGTSASRAANLLRTSLHFLYAPSSKGETALESIGLSSTKLADDLRKPRGLLLALTDLHDHLGSLSAVKQEQLLADLFPAGRGWVLQTLLNQLDRYGMKLNQIQRTSSQFGQDVAKTQQTAAYKIHTAWSTVQADAINFGHDVLPELLKVGDDVVKGVDTVTHAFTTLPKGAQDTIIKGGLILASIGPAMRLLGVFTSGIGRLYSVASLFGRMALGQTGGSATAAARALSSSVATMEVGTLIAKSTIGAGSVGGARWPLAGTPTGPAATEETSLGALPIAADDASMMSKVGGVLLQGIGVAGMAAMAAPIAIGLAKAIGSALTGPSYGTTIAHNVFSHGFGGSQAPSLAKQTQQALDELHRLTTVTTGTTTTGGAHAERIPVVAHLQLDQLTGARYDAAEAAAKRAGGLVAQQLEAGWNQYKFQSEPTMLLQLRSKLKDLPPAAQAAAVNSAVKFSEGLEQQGRLAKGSTARMLSGVEAQFPGFEQYLGLSGRAGIKQFNTAFDLSGAEDKVRAQIHKISQDFVTVQDAVSKTNDTVQAKTAATVKALLRIQSNGTAPAVALATKDLAHLRQVTATDMDKASGSVVAWMKQMSYELGPNLLGASKTAAGHLSDFTAHIVTAMQNGSLATGKGMNLIIKTLNAALKEMGQKQLSPIQVGALTLGIGKTNQLVQHGATGGLMQIGRPGEAGHDSVPLNVGGTPIVVAPGEQVAVFNRHQLPIVNAALAPMGGLPGLFSRVTTPHYMASGGFTGYSLPLPRTMMSNPGNWSVDQGVDIPGGAGGEPEYAIGPGKIIAEGIGGFGPNAPVLQISAGPLAGRSIYYGHAGPDLVPVGATVRAGQQISSVGQGIVGISSGPHIEIGWYPPGAMGAGASMETVLHQLLGGAGVTGVGGAVAAALTAIAAPAVKGSGTIAQIVRAVLGAAAKGANAYEAAHAPAAGIGAAGAASLPSITSASLTALNHPYPRNGSAVFSPSLVAAIAQWAALPGVTFSQIAEGESSYMPGEVEPSEGPGIGGVPVQGWGLWQITTGVGNDAMIASFGGTDAMLNPLINAKAAKNLYTAAGNTVAPWHGTRYLTSPNAQYTGKPLGAAQGLLTNFQSYARTGARHLPTTTTRTTKSNPKAPAHKNAKHSKPFKLPKFKSLPGFDSGPLDQITSLDNYLTNELGPWETYVLGLHGRQTVQPLVTLADGSEVVNWDGMIDPTTGQFDKGIGARLVEIGQLGGAHPDLNTELGIDQQYLNDYFQEQALATLADKRFRPWLSRMLRDAAKQQDDVADTQATINRLTLLKQKLPKEKADRTFAINQRFEQLKHSLQVKSATGRFSASELLTQQLNLLALEEHTARAAIPTAAPGDWTGTKKGWTAEAALERTAVTDEFTQRRAAIEDAARKNNFAGSLSLSNARYGLTLQEQAEKQKLSDVFSQRSTDYADELTSGRSWLARDKRLLASDQKALTAATGSPDGQYSAVTGSGSFLDTIKAYLDPMGTLALNILQKKNIDIPNLLDEISSLTGTTVPAGSVSVATSQLNADLLTQHQYDLASEAVLAKQYEALKLPAFGGSFYSGGTVPGAPGEPRTIIAHGGEQYLGVGASRQSPDVRVRVEDHRVRVWVNDVEQIVQNTTRKMSRTAGRRLPGGGGGGLGSFRS